MPQSWLSKGLKLFFKLLYHQLSWAYDAVAYLVSWGLWRDWVMSVLPFIRGPNVLEIGHGPGHLLVALKNAGYDAIGLDESREMGRLAVQRLSGFGLDMLLVNGYAHFMPFPNNVFHTICATFPSDYILQPDTLAEAFRILVPGGRLIILPSASFSSTSIPGRMFDRLFGAAGLSHIQDNGYAQNTLAAGFQVTTQICAIKSSQVWIILAIKP